MYPWFVGSRNLQPHNQRGSAHVPFLKEAMVVEQQHAHPTTICVPVANAPSAMP